MAFFTSNSIGGRFRLAFGSLFLALAMVGGVGLYQANQLNAATNDLALDRLPSVSALGHVEEAVNRFRQLQASAILASDAAARDGVLRYKATTLAEIQAAWQGYQPMVDPGEERDRLAPAVDAAWKAYLAQDAQLDHSDLKASLPGSEGPNPYGQSSGSITSAFPAAGRDRRISSNSSNIGAVVKIIIL
jgi:methyl-accepting chemotaxis protein